MLPRYVRPRRNVEISPQAEAFLTSLRVPKSSWTGPLKRQERETLNRWISREERAHLPPFSESRIRLGKAADVDGYVFWFDVYAKRRPGEERAYLAIGTPLFHFRESAAGQAELTLRRHEIPEIILVSINGSRPYLREISQTENWFFEVGDPIVWSASKKRDTNGTILKLRYD